MGESRLDRTADVLGASACVPEHVVYRPFAQETVVLNLTTGRYHGLNPTAGVMLTELERSATVADAASRLAAHFGRPIEEIECDLVEFCLDLSERGLITLSAPGRSSSEDGSADGAG